MNCAKVINVGLRCVVEERVHLWVRKRRILVNIDTVTNGGIVGYFGGEIGFFFFRDGFQDVDGSFRVLFVVMLLSWSLCSS